MELFRDRRFVLVFLLTVAMAGFFLSTSRMPQLNEKALMGGEVELEAIGFDQVFEVKAGDPVYLKVLYTAINWAKTNKNGMTFGILFAPVMMTLLALFRRRSFNNGFADSLLGMTIGSPLGVCVNCAAPIAEGLRSGGASTQTMLAAMMSSPTMNIVVLTMLFSLLPLYLVVIKLGLTLGFILIGIPVITRLIASHSPAAIADEVCALPLATAGSDGNENWPSAALWVLRNYSKNLWFITKRTVPLMILAGLLGAVVVTVLPLDALADILPNSRPIFILAGMALVACVGIFLPVPMTFDVIIVAVLVSAGLPARYAAILLFTLGIFSIYAFFIAWNAVPRRVVVAVSAVLVVLGFSAGFLGEIGYKWHAANERKLFISAFAKDTSSAPSVARTGHQAKARPAADLITKLRANPLSLIPFPVSAPGGISVASIPFEPVEGAEGLQFQRLEGIQIGIDEPMTYSVASFLELERFRSVATGDVHNDGWPDLLLSSDHGVSLYANRQGEGFVRQEIDLGPLTGMRVTNAALVDLDDDGWLDIFIACYRGGNHVIYNRTGDFPPEGIVSLPNQHQAVTTAAAAFADVDRDGDLDIAIGNWSIGNIGIMNHSFTSSENFLLHNGENGFESELLDGHGGETLSVLLSDIDDDGLVDLVTGSDFGAADYYYLGRDDGRFKTVTADDGIIPVSTGSTMNVSSADIDNDLHPEVYLGQISGRRGGGAVHFRRLGPWLCDEISDPDFRAGCEHTVEIQSAIVESVDSKSASRCAAVDDEFKDDCIAVVLLWSAARWDRNPELCELFPDAWEQFRFACRHSHRAKQQKLTTDLLETTIPQRRGNNVLLAKGEGSKFKDRAGELGLLVAGWTWNAKFADLDNDEWQDMFAVNGQPSQSSREPNYLFHNEAGQKFTDVAEEWGVSTYMSIGGYSYVDMDRDGDLDIIAAPSDGPILVFENRASAGTSAGKSIAFEIRDGTGNHFGIGTRLSISYGPDDGRHQMREIQTGGGFASYDEPVAYFGLGEYERINIVEVRWSTGERSELRGEFLAGSRYVISRAADFPVRMATTPEPPIGATARVFRDIFEVPDSRTSSAWP